MRPLPYALLLLALSCPWSARADDEASTPAQLAEQALEAFRASDTERLRALAAADHPDPWLVADALLSRQAPEAARAFAGAAPRKEVASLPDYVSGLSDASELAGDARALENAVRADQVGDAEDVVRVLEGRPSGPASVVGVRIHFLRGRALSHLIRYPESAAAHLAAADLARRLGWHAQEAHALYEAGVASYLHADYGSALQTFERRLEVETGLGSKMGIGRAHFGLASAYEALGRYEEEETHRESAREYADASRDFEYIAKVLSQDALARSREGDPEACLAVNERMLKALDQVEAGDVATRFRPDPRNIAESRAHNLLNSASWSAMLGRLDDVRRYGTEAVRSARATGDAVLVDRSRAQIATLEAELHRMQDENLEALAALDRARRLYERAQDRRRLADTLSRLGQVHHRLGDTPAAISRLEDAVALLREMDARPELSRAEYRIGVVSVVLGRFEEAQDHLEEALRLFRALGDRPREINALTSLSHLHRRRADLARAMDLIEEALRLQEAGGDPQNRAILQLSVAQVRFALGETEEAVRLAQESAELLEAAGDTYNARTARNQLAPMLVDLGRIEEAYQSLEAMLDTLDPANNRSSIGETFARMADIRFQQRRYTDALSLRGKALGMFVAANSASQAVTTRIQMARERFWSGERDRAVDELTDVHEEALELGAPEVLIDSAVALTEAHLFLANYEDAMQWARYGLRVTAETGLDLADEESAGYRSQFSPLHEMGVAAAMRVSSIEDAYQFLESGRATTLLASLGGRDALREVTVSAELRQAEEEARAAEAMAGARLARARRRGVLDEIAEEKRALQAARDEVHRVVARIQRQARMQADLTYHAVKPLAEVRAELSEDDALVLYAETLDRVTALVVTRQSARVFELGYLEQVKDALRELLPDEGTPVRADAVEAVRALLVEPLRLADTTKRLLISPGGSLSFVPYALLADERDVVLLPSATALVPLNTMGEQRGREVLALGDPDYGTAAALAAAASGDPRLRGGRLAPLPETREEARSIGDVVLLGPDASETRFRQTVERDLPWRAVHLACHGLVDTTRPTLSSLALTADAENDGFLTALDVFRLRIPAELVVLSGCETGRGRAVAGEGMLGLTRAFMYAGSPRVLVSLWEVDDAATRALMTKFYELWNPSEGSGVGAATALRQAQAFVRAQEGWEDPRFWAAWVLWGLPD